MKKSPTYRKKRPVKAGAPSRSFPPRKLAKIKASSRKRTGKRVQKNPAAKKIMIHPLLTAEAIRKHHAALLARSDLVEYMQKQRCWSSQMIEEHLVGLVKIGKWEWLTFPIVHNGHVYCLKLKKPPAAPEHQLKGKFFPAGKKATLYPLPFFNFESEQIVWCAGEPDTIAARSIGLNAICGTAGENTFQESWIEILKTGGTAKTFYSLCDHDDAGKTANEKICSLVSESCPDWEVRRVEWPEEFPKKGDVTVFLRQYKGDDPAGALLALTKPYTPSGQSEKSVPIDLSQFQPMTSQDVTRILGLTVKKDNANKLITFLSMMTAYTENDQTNVLQNAPSASGKTYIPLEVSKLFPKEDVIKIGYCSPQAFFHDHAAPEEDEENEKKGKKGKVKKNEKKQPSPLLVDLSRKILIFLDMPHVTLLERLRPLLSHDEKEMQVKITDKSKKGQNRTKTIIIRGFPTVIFCTAGLAMDEQEATRFFLLSPEMDQEKLREAIEQRINKESDKAAHAAWLDAQPERALLMKRILAIKQEKIEEVRILQPAMIQERFLRSRPVLKPRHQRDIGRIFSLVKAFALLNVMHRKRDGNTILADESDIDEAFTLWDSISESQEHNLPPFIYELYRKVILPAYSTLNPDPSDLFPHNGLTLQDIQKKHVTVCGRMISPHTLRQQVLPMLEAAGLITEEKDPSDARRHLYFPLDLSPQPDTGTPKE